jgi:[ribosomal protein S5]-alanine N-acetyltransferase
MGSMPILTSSRLFLVPLTRAMMRARLSAVEFSLDLVDIGTVAFPSSWPGDALATFEGFLKVEGDPVPLSYVAIHRAELVAVGQLGATSEIVDGEIEIGYGFGMPGRGFATEAVGTLVAQFLDSPAISTVTANTAIGNVASQRVLEKNRFVHSGTSWSEDDGDLVVWRRD